MLSSHPTNYAGAIKKKQARLALSKNKTTSIEEGMFEVHVNLTEPVTHHLNDSSFLAMQENTINIPCDEIEDMFVKHCADEYSMGVSENNLKESVDSILQLRATSYAIVQTIQHAQVNCMLCVLFDLGSDKTLIKQSVLPLGINPSIGKKRKVIGVTASSIMDWEVIIENMTLPEFSSTQRVSGPIRAFVIDNNESHYDLIIGMDVMQILGIDIHNSSKTIVWDTLRVPFKPQDYFKGAFPHSLVDTMMGSPDPADTNGYKSKTIKSALYEANDPHVVAQQQKHLTASQRQDLTVILSKYPKLFSGELGRYPHRKVHLELRDDAKPTRCRPYPVPKHHEKVFKEELDWQYYYTFELDKASKDLCTIVTPFGNYRYNRLPMGVSQSPDIAQEIMEEVFQHLRDAVEVYIDGIGVFSNDWQSYCIDLTKVLDFFRAITSQLTLPNVNGVFKKLIGWVIG